MLTLRLAAVTACFFVCAPLAAQPMHINLADYRLAATYSLPPFVAEASGITYRPDSGTLFITGDEGLGIAEFTRRGTLVSQMSLTGFVDTEGLAFVGGGRFVITEERDQDAYLFMYAPGGSTARASMQSVSFGVTIGNVGIEGICYESLTDRYFAVKEKTPERILFGSINFAAGSTDATDLFAPASLNLLDIADVAVLSAVPSLIGRPDQDNLLIISQESARVVEATRTGVVQSTLSLSGIATTAEGITIDERGTIFVVDETPRLLVFERVCTADFNDDGTRDVLDIFSFLSAWFASDPAANFDGLGGTEVQDIFSFLSAWFGGCS